jgi:nitrite reductase (NADH) small subunit/3-phenylpropionate/trans-cinnamate dioxygenase ferredoxin subunit
MSEFQTVGKVGSLADGQSAVAQVNGKPIAIFFTEGRYYAIDDFCPHMGASLAGGAVENGIVSCPWHAWRFRLSDGAWADNPRVKTGCYAVQVVGDDVQVCVPPPTLRQPGSPPKG